MQKYIVLILVLLIAYSCIDLLTVDEENDTPRILYLEDIKREYAIADSLNRLEDKSNMDLATRILGMDYRNGQTIIRTCLDRGFGCMMYSDFHTILYLNCDSVCCETKGIWEVDYLGIAGQYSPVGCAPDTVSTEIADCGCPK